PPATALLFDDAARLAQEDAQLLTGGEKLTPFVVLGESLGEEHKTVDPPQHWVFVPLGNSRQRLAPVGKIRDKTFERRLETGLGGTGLRDRGLVPNTPQRP